MYYIEPKIKKLMILMLTGCGNDLYLTMNPAPISPTSLAIIRAVSGTAQNI